MKFKDRNEQLKASLNSMPASKKSLVASSKIPEPDTVNRQGHKAYKVEDTLLLVSMLNTLKLEPQYYRSDSKQMSELQDLIEKVSLAEGTYFVAQAIVYSRCLGEGMRSVNHLAAALLAPLISGEPWAKRFYSFWNKKDKKGGCIYRPDDMEEIKDAFSTINNHTLTNAMKKGFAEAIQNLDAYSVFKYKKAIINISNLVHPNIGKCKGMIEVEGKNMVAVDALMKGVNISADTWEVAQSQAGQEIAKAVKENKLTEDEAAELLSKAKNDNWKSLLEDNKLGILAALRNIRNILNGEDYDTVNLLCKLISDKNRILNGKIMPYQIDLAYEVVRSEFNNDLSKLVTKALLTGYESSVPNLAELLTGKNLVILDCSGSMTCSAKDSNTGKSIRSSCLDKAAIIAATIVKSTRADCVVFGSSAKWVNLEIDKLNVFQIADYYSTCSMGCTYLASAFNLIKRENKKYDRIFILSDNECNVGSNKLAYKEYVRGTCDPYIYSIDLAAYGTKPISSDKVGYYFGYGYAMFDDISNKEFNPAKILDKIRAIEL